MEFKTRSSRLAPAGAQNPKSQPFQNEEARTFAQPRFEHDFSQVRAHAVLQRQPLDAPPKKEENVGPRIPHNNAPAAPAPANVQGSSQPCSKNMGGSTGLCTPQRTTLQAVRALFTTPPKDLILGRTDSLGGGTISPISTRPAGRGKVVLETISVTPSCCTSFYAGVGTYPDTVTPVNGPPVQRRLIITKDGEKRVRAAEQEHCDDLQYAFKISLYAYAKKVNDLARRKKKFASQADAETAITNLVGLEPAKWPDRYVALLKRTAIRDARSWHSANGPGSVVANIPATTNRTTGAVRIPPVVVDGNSFPEVGKHKTRDLIK